MLQKLGYASLLPVLIGLVACTQPPAADPSTVTPTPSQPPAAQTSLPADTLRSTPANPTEALPDAVIIPGERVGPVTATTGRADLANLLGEAQLSDQDINVGEGMMEPGTVVNFGPNRALTILWTDATRSKPAAVTDLGSGWKTPEGLGIGSSLAELEKALGDFQLYGFAWDYGGTILLENTKLNRYQGQLILRIQPPDPLIEQYPAAYEAVMGDQTFESTNPNMQLLQPVVYDMTVYLNPNQ